MKIIFNKPYITGKELEYISEAISFGHISGNGIFTKKCQQYFEEKWDIKKCLLTTSCTDALEMCAMLLNIKEGDEIITPTFTFVSTALAFTRQKAKIVFAESREDHPGIDENKIESLITKNTKAIVVVHYAGVACNMDKIMRIASKYNIYVIEDAAQAIDSFYKGKQLGTFGHFGCFSFHETKNIQSGEGGLVLVNDEDFLYRSEIIWDKGTNRAQFFRGEINKYGWVDTGSSFLPSDILAAFLYAQIEDLNSIQKRRKTIWYNYFNGLKVLETKGLIKLPKIPKYATNNAHMFYFLCKSEDERSALIKHLKFNGIYATFHYQCLHSSKFQNNAIENDKYKNAYIFQDSLIRLPLFVELSYKQQKEVMNQILSFYDITYCQR